MNPQLGAYRALDRIVLIPAYREDGFSLAISDDESLVICPVTIPDKELGATAIRLLRNQRRRDFPADFRSDSWRRRIAARSGSTKRHA